MSLLMKVYIKRPLELPKEVALGIWILKEHYCYRRQYKKIHCRTNGFYMWFCDCTDAFVDEFMKFNTF
jgi:hypothetical protein